MYDIKLRYLATAYVDADSITPESDNVAGALKALDDERFVSIPAFQNVEGKRVPRIGFMAPDGWTFVLGGTRFDLSLRPTVGEGDNMGEFSDFCKEAPLKLISALAFFDRKAHRLAVVREGMLPEMEVGEMEAVARHLLNMSPTFTQNQPFEWNWRSAALIDRTFGGISEPTNTIVTVSRLAGTLGPDADGENEVEFDRLRVDLDINTTPKNVKARFGTNEILAYFEAAQDWHKSLGNEISAFLAEGLRNE